jgi:hypothetical protein
MSIHVYIWLCIENEEVIVEEEETAPPTETPPAGSSFVVEPPELFQFKCLSPTLKARPHLNRNKTSVSWI